MDFVITNGRVTAKDEMSITPFIDQDTLQLSFNTWFGYGGIPFYGENIILLLEQLQLFKIPVPSILKNQRELFRITKRMLNKNKFYRSGLVHLQLYCNNQHVNSFITSKSFREFRFLFRTEGILLNYSAHRKYSKNKINRYPFGNQPIWQLLRHEIAGTHFKNSIILNENNGICECINSNIFIIKQNKLVTPSLNSGCYKDVFRDVILQLASELGLDVQEEETIEPAVLPDASEIFIAGEEYGMDWVLGIGNKRFVHHYSSVIHEKLNDLLQQRAH